MKYIVRIDLTMTDGHVRVRKPVEVTAHAWKYNDTDVHSFLFLQGSPRQQLDTYLRDRLRRHAEPSDTVSTPSTSPLQPESFPRSFTKFLTASYKGVIRNSQRRSGMNKILLP
jgi:hypothetical protein